MLKKADPQIIESKIKSDIFIKMISLIGKNNSLNKVFKKFADSGLQP